MDEHEQHRRQRENRLLVALPSSYAIVLVLVALTAPLQWPGFSQAALLGIGAAVGGAATAFGLVVVMIRRGEAPTSLTVPETGPERAALRMIMRGHSIAPEYYKAAKSVIGRIQRNQWSAWVCLILAVALLANIVRFSGEVRWVSLGCAVPVGATAAYRLFQVWRAYRSQCSLDHSNE